MLLPIQLRRKLIFSCWQENISIYSLAVCNLCVRLGFCGNQKTLNFLHRCIRPGVGHSQPSLQQLSNLLNRPKI